MIASKVGRYGIGLHVVAACGMVWNDVLSPALALGLHYRVSRRGDPARKRDISWAHSPVQKFSDRLTLLMSDVTCTLSIRGQHHVTGRKSSVNVGLGSSGAVCACVPRRGEYTTDTMHTGDTESILHWQANGGFACQHLAPQVASASLPALLRLGSGALVLGYEVRAPAERGGEGRPCLLPLWARGIAAWSAHGRAQAVPYCLQSPRGNAKVVDALVQCLQVACS